MKKNVVIVLLSFCAFSFAPVPYAVSHCQIPCGIYDDDARFEQFAENLKTVEKAMIQIKTLSKNKKTNINQLVRWVQTKEKHADDNARIITHYFMAQRIKVESDSSSEYDGYIKKITTLHRMLVYTMKTKQTVDTENITKLRKLLTQFKISYTAK